MVGLFFVTRVPHFSRVLCARSGFFTCAELRRGIHTLCIVAYSPRLAEVEMIYDVLAGVKLSIKSPGFHKSLLLIPRPTHGNQPQIFSPPTNGSRRSYQSPPISARLR